MTTNVAFEEEKKQNIASLMSNAHLQQLALEIMCESAPYKYTYNFTWMGLPIIQLPQDIVALQELIWSVRPEVVVETGIAHGGGAVFYASMLELLGGDRFVIGVDVDIRPHNRAAIESHPMARRIRMIEGSSIDPAVVAHVTRLAHGRKTMVVLDSDHSRNHVFEELRAYSPLVGSGSYVAVLDTIIEDQPEGFYKGRPWNKINNPKVAVRDFLKENDRFVVDSDLEGKLLLTVAREGYLRCVKD